MITIEKSGIMYRNKAQLKFVTDLIETQIGRASCRERV